MYNPITIKTTTPAREIKITPPTTIARARIPKLKTMPNALIINSNGNIPVS
jgi:hypothetical protein